jgi:hypothetical protein
MAPRGPSPDLGLPDKANAWTLPREPGSNAWEASAAAAADQPPPSTEGHHGPHLDFGVGVYVYQPPHFSHNVAFIEAAPGSVTEFDFGYPQGVAPRLWLGVTADNGLGFRMDWTHYYEKANSIRSLPANNKGALLQENTDRNFAMGFVPTGLMGPTTITTPAPFPGFGITSPDTSIDLSGLIPGSLLPGGVGGDNFLLPGTPASALGNGLIPDVLTFSNSLKMDVWDWEASGGFNLGRFIGVGVGVGMRYAYISQSYAARRTNNGSFSLTVVDGATGLGDDEVQVNIDEDSSVMIAGESFGGVGPTVSCSLQARLPWLTGLSVFANARGSLLFGQQKLQVFQRTKFIGRLIGESATDTDNVIGVDNLTQVFPFHYDAFTQNILTGKDVWVPNADLEVGIGWGIPVGNADVFVQASFVTQFWQHVGSATDLVGNLRLVGLNVSAGFDF